MPGIFEDPALQGLIRQANNLFAQFPSRVTTGAFRPVGSVQSLDTYGSIIDYGNETDASTTQTAR